MRMYLFYLLLAFTLCSCANIKGPRIEGIFLRETIPQNDAHYQWVDDYTSKLCAESDLKMKSAETVTSKIDDFRSVYLISDKTGISVNVILYIKDRFLYILIIGKESESKGDFYAKKCERLYESMYPGRTLERFERYSGLMGP